MLNISLLRSFDLLANTTAILSSLDLTLFLPNDTDGKSDVDYSSVPFYASTDFVSFSVNESSETDRQCSDICSGVEI